MIRFAVPQDTDALLDIYRPYVEHTAITFETQVPSRAEFLGRIIAFSETYPYLVAEEDGKILGYAYAHAFRERAAYAWTAETSIYVHPEARGRHIGKQLYGALLPLLKAQGFRNACAVITIPNEPSIGLHTHMGFQMGGVLPNFGYKQGQWHSVAYLYLPLSDSENTPEPVIPVHQLPKALVQALLS